MFWKRSRHKSGAGPPDAPKTTDGVALQSLNDRNPGSSTLSPERPSIADSEPGTMERSECNAPGDTPSLTEAVENAREPLIQGRIPAPRLPADTRIYAVGDIHGRLDLLDCLLTRIEDDLAARPSTKPVLVFLGDYVDRGPSSCEVIERLMQLATLRECVFLKGNHEQMLMRCLSDGSVLMQWMRLGGRTTLQSYAVPGVPPMRFPDEKQVVRLQDALQKTFPASHLDFLRELRPSYACGDYFFAHAGVKPGIQLSQQKESDLLWIRNEFLSSELDFGGIVVHGHTPTREIEVRSNRINIDTGAFATNRLTCLVIEETLLAVIDTIDGSGRRNLNVAPALSPEA